MLVQPDLVPFDQWIENFTDDELCELMGLEQYELDDLRDTQATDTCPSCDGDRTIDLEHSFKVDGKTVTNTYECECSHCDGEGDVDLGMTDFDVAIRKEYDAQVKQDLAKYLLVLDDGHI